MKRSELRKIFEGNLKDIKVSDTLKEKTINNISKKNIYHFPYWLKNCAAILVVSTLCLSIYVINKPAQSGELSNEENSIYNVNNLSNAKEEATLETKKTASPFSSTLDSGVAMNKASCSEIILEDSLDTNYIDNSYIGMTKEEFLLNNPDAKLEENKLIIKENGITVSYIIENNIIIGKIN